MAEQDQHANGTIGWTDLTVPDADNVRDFYAAVVGWKVDALDMGGYSDYVMCAPETGAPVCGVCHARGVNVDIPPVWLIYIYVADLDASLAACRASGGTVVVGPKEMSGQGRYAIIRDPAGAHSGLFQRTTQAGEP